MKKSKITANIVVLFAILFLCIGCRKKEKVTEEIIRPIQTEIPTEIPTKKPTEEPTKPPTKKQKPAKESRTGKTKSKLTGLWVDEKIAESRPYAVMFNNIKIASPQGGTAQASILYEAIAEGGITRLMGIYEDFNSERIGSVRSARHYFVSFADEYDAILVHFGQSTYGKKKIAELGINNLNGLDRVGETVFYRDSSIKAPHNAFASTQRILKGTKQKEYRTKYKEGFEGHFNFYKKDVTPKSKEKAEKITLKFSNYMSPYFEYNQKKKLYYRFQFGKTHIDKNTGEQLAFKNILIQFVKQWTLDKKGYQSMDIENSSGIGYYITNGKKIDITWKKNESKKEMFYYDADGKKLTLNPGKTYIAIFPNTNRKGVVLE